MNNIYKTKYLKKNSGMTLVELIVSVFLLSLVGLMLITVFSLSTKVVGDNAMSKKKSENAAAGIETKVAFPGASPAPTSVADIYKISSTPSNLTVEFNGTIEVDVNMPGIMVASTDANDENKYYYFIPD